MTVVDRVGLTPGQTTGTSSGSDGEAVVGQAQAGGVRFSFVEGGEEVGQESSLAAGLRGGEEEGAGAGLWDGGSGGLLVLGDVDGEEEADLEGDGPLLELDDEDLALIEELEGGGVRAPPQPAGQQG